MQTTRGPGVRPAGGIFTGESMSTLSDEVDFRMHRLEIEAADERLVGTRSGLLQNLGRAGHAVLALGRVSHLRPHLPHAHGPRP